MLRWWVAWWPISRSSSCEVIATWCNIFEGGQCRQNFWPRTLWTSSNSTMMLLSIVHACHWLTAFVALDIDETGRTLVLLHVLSDEIKWTDAPISIHFPSMLLRKRGFAKAWGVLRRTANKANPLSWGGEVGSEFGDEEIVWGAH